MEGGEHALEAVPVGTRLGRRCSGQVSFLALLLFSSSFPATDSFLFFGHRLFLHSLLYLFRSNSICSAATTATSRVRANHKGQVDNGRTIALSTTTLFSHARSHRTLDHSSHLSGTTHCASGRVLVSSHICWRGWGNYRLIFKLYR